MNQNSSCKPEMSLMGRLSLFFFCHCKDLSLPPIFFWGRQRHSNAAAVIFLCRRHRCSSTFRPTRAFGRHSPDRSTTATRSSQNVHSIPALRLPGTAFEPRLPTSPAGRSSSPPAQCPSSMRSSGEPINSLFFASAVCSSASVCGQQRSFTGSAATFAVLPCAPSASSNGISPAPS